MACSGVVCSRRSICNPAVTGPSHQAENSDACISSQHPQQNGARSAHSSARHARKQVAELEGALGAARRRAAAVQDEAAVSAERAAAAGAAARRQLEEAAERAAELEEVSTDLIAAARVPAACAVTAC